MYTSLPFAIAPKAPPIPDITCSAFDAVIPSNCNGSQEGLQQLQAAEALWTLVAAISTNSAMLMVFIADNVTMLKFRGPFIPDAS